MVQDPCQVDPPAGYSYDKSELFVLISVHTILGGTLLLAQSLYGQGILSLRCDYLIGRCCWKLA